MIVNKGFFYRVLLFVGMAVMFIGVQAKEITGKVTDREGNPVHGASVVVMSLPDSVFASTAVTDAVGVVRFDAGDTDSVLVTVQILGFERYQETVGSDFTAILEPVSTQLQEVVVEAKPEYRTEAGKLVFTPGDLVKRVNNAQDILQYVPMVRVLGNDISILGSPQTIVYVNGKPPRGMMADIKNLIKSLPPSCIKRVELIRNPGASVAGSYSGAIVNIVMTYPWEGLVGIVDASAYLKPDMITPSGTIGLYYTKNKWSFAYVGGYTSWGEDDKNENYYEYKQDYPNGIKSYINDTHYRNRGNTLSNFFTANYNFTDRSILGLRAGFGWSGTKRKNITTTTYTTIEGKDLERRSAVRDTLPFGTPYVRANLFYTLQTDDKGSNIDVVFGYYVSQTKTHTGIFNPENTLFQNKSDFGVGWGGSAEYQHRFSKRVRLKVGAGFSSGKKDDGLDFYENSNRFIYKENLLHAFGEIRFPWHRTGFVVGLRVETEFNSGDVRTTGDSFERNSTAILPSVSFDWQMPWHNQSLSVSVSQSVFRPAMSNLNPFRIWTSENAYSEGNPYLKNYYFLQCDLNYMCVKNIMLHAKYERSFGSRNPVTLPDEQGLMATTYHNGPGNYYIHAGASYSKELFSFWNMEASAGYRFNHAKYEVEGVPFKQIYNSGYLSVQSIFNFSKKLGFFGTIDYTLSTPFKRFNDSRGGWDNDLTVSARKDWKNCSLSLYAFGLIPSRRRDYNFDSDIYIAKYNKTNYGPTIVLSFRYVFGNKNVRTATSRDARVGSRLDS